LQGLNSCGTESTNLLGCDTVVAVEVLDVLKELCVPATLGTTSFNDTVLDRRGLQSTARPM